MIRDLPATGIATATWLESNRVKSFAAVALKSGERILGVTVVFSRRELNGAELALLDVAASNAARAVEALARTHATPRAAEVPARTHATPRASGRSSGDAEEPTAPMTLDEAQRRAITRALELSGGLLSGPRGAAARLGIHPNTLASRMIRLGMRKRRPRAVT
jgi:transcriptional regulator with GAF, ATPase, and Fis domain